MGTNLSEDHPAFQAPSLFTDNPSYEDMVLLSTLLGPVKPPVASANDIADAQGLYRLETRRAEGQWMATVLDRAPDGDSTASSSLVEMPKDVESCQVCLAEYEVGEEVRELQGCSHVFHRECVETVSFIPLDFHCFGALLTLIIVADDRPQFLPTMQRPRCPSERRRKGRRGRSKQRKSVSHSICSLLRLCLFKERNSCQDAGIHHGYNIHFSTPPFPLSAFSFNSTFLEFPIRKLALLLPERYVQLVRVERCINQRRQYFLSIRCCNVSFGQ